MIKYYMPNLFFYQKEKNVSLFFSSISPSWGLRMVVSDLNEGENSFRRPAENLPGMVYRVLLEDDNQVIFFNGMVQTMTGYRPEDVFCEN